MSLTFKEYEIIRNEIDEIDDKIDKMKTKKEKLQNQIETKFKLFEDYLKKYESRFAEPVKSLMHFYQETVTGLKTSYWQINLRFDKKAYRVTDLPRIEDPKDKFFFYWYVQQVQKSMGTYYHLKLEIIG